MGKGLGQRRRARKRSVGFVAVVITTVLGMAAPALGALVLNLDLTPARESATVPNAVGVTNVPGGITQTKTTVDQLLAGLKNAVAVGAPFVQAHATEAAGVAIENLVARAQATIAAAAALDPAGAQAELTGVVSDLQGQALGEVGGLLPLALTTGLQVAQDIVSPVCSLTAVPSSFLPGVGVDTTRLWSAALPGIQQIDQGTNKLIRDTYAKVYDQTLASVNSIPGVGPILSVLLLLLKYEWTTTYTPPGSATPIVTKTKALMDVPTPIDVDNDGLFDLCGTTAFALAGSGTSISGLSIKQTITKMPLAKPVLPVQIGGGLLNVINFGYDSRESTVPIVYTSAVTLDGSALNVDNTFSVHRGTNLTIPPLSLNALDLPAGVVLPTIPPLFTPAPKPIVAQEICIGACTGIAIRDRFENVPSTTHVSGPLASAGVNTTYSASSTSDSYSHAFALGDTITLGTSAGRDRTVPVVTTPSAPTSFVSCMSISDGTCSPNARAGDKFSSSMTSNSPTFGEQNVAIGGPIAPDCVAVAPLGVTVQVTGSSFNYSSVPSTTTAGSGHIGVDTANKPVDGCIGAGSVLALTGMSNVKLPSGFQAANRSSVYHHTLVLGFLLGDTVIESKSGQIICPTGTAAGYGSLSPLGTFDLAPVICFVAPVNTVAPAITGQALVDSTLTVGNGTWTPGAPNAPTFTRQWYRCNAAGVACAPISGATGTTYALDFGPGPASPLMPPGCPAEPTDCGKTFKAIVTATNLDAPAGVPATSNTTDVVGLPPAPSVLTKPALGSNRKVGLPTTSVHGTYLNGASTFTYQWERCDAAGNLGTCADIPGATSQSYVVQAADKGMTIRIGEIGSNHGGFAPENFSLTVQIPGDPANTAAPGIKNGPTNAVGATVATGDNLSASTGTWDQPATFDYQWQRCDEFGTPASCVNIAGATGALYQLQAPADTGSSVRVVVTAHGLNGDGTAASGATGKVEFNDLSAKNVTQIPDGTVNATVAGAGTTTYVGGAFDTVGAPTGGSGIVSASGAGNTLVPNSASATAGAANGGVNATVPDGSGGYFLGGSFTQVKGVQCPTLAHLLANGTVDPNYCYSGMTGVVTSLSRVSGGVSKVLVVGGAFSYGGHANLMFVDPASPASPVYLAGGDPNGEVKSISLNTATNNIVYLGGKFSSAGGTQASLLASATLTWTSGQLSGATRTNWVAGACIGTPTGTSACTDAAATVNTVQWLTSNFVAVGGRFDRSYRIVNGASPSTTGAAGRTNALLVGDAGTAPALLGWSPNPNGPVNAIAIGPNNGAFSFQNIPIYLGGDFTVVNGVAAKNLAEAGTTSLGAAAGAGNNNNSGMMQTWLPNPNGPVTSLAYVGDNNSATLIVGGAFTTIDSRPNTTTPFTTLVRHRLAKINIGVYNGATLPVVDGTWDPNAGRTVRTVSRDATLGTVTVGGDFLVLGGQTRNNLAEFDPNLGVSSWNPGANGVVRSLAFDGGTVYAGGDFTGIGPALTLSPRARLASINGASGAVNAWNPGADGSVNAIATDGPNVIVGGAFGNAGGQPRANVATISSGGAATGWNPGTNGPVNAIVVAGGNAYIGGSFTTAASVPRNNAAAIDGTGAATGFDPNTNGQVNAIAITPAGVYLGGAFTTVGADGRAHVALVDALTGATLVWNPGVDGTVNAVFIFGSNVFVGGSFATAGGAGRLNLAALDTGDGSAKSFNPAPNGTVNALSRTSGGSIAVGGSFSIISGQAAPALGFYGG